MPVIERIRAWWAARGEAWNESRLRSTRRALKDAAYDKEKWGWADTPSREEDRNARIYSLIRRYDELGGDVLKELPWSQWYMASAAMPEKFEQRRARHGNGWDTVRIGEEEEAA